MLIVCVMRYCNMQSEIKLVISNNDKVIQTVTKEVNGQSFVKAVEDFQIVANATMTKLIEESGASGDCNMEEDGKDSDADEDKEHKGVSPKRKKT